jgi:hypothetical protein
MFFQPAQAAGQRPERGGRDSDLLRAARGSLPVLTNIALAMSTGHF